VGSPVDGLSICRVTHALYPDVVGGHAVFCHELSMRQADLGHRINVLTTRRGRQPERELAKKGYEITRLGRVWMPWDSLGMQNPVIPSLYGAVREQHCDLVDAHAHLFWTTALSVKAAIDTGRPVVTTVHGFLALRDWLVNLSQRLYLWSVGAWVLRNSSCVVCLTQSDAREVAGLGVRKRNIRVIPVAVDPNVFRPSGPKRKMIVWVGRLVPEKGLETLLEAVATLHGKKAVRVLIVGDGPLRNRLIGRARALGISDMVTFRFKADRSEVAKILRESQIFVLPSLKEGLPMTLLEAMASADTVVASNLPSIVETLGAAGLYFTPGESGELASTLLQALNDGELQRESGRVGREIVENRFSWRVVLPMLNDLYAEVAAG
jgi:glycosyltransferase involved in cell wall biosynthesis